MAFLFNIKTLAIVLLLIACTSAHPEEEATESADAEKRGLPRPGRGHYVPELYRHERGKWMPDESGRYMHMKVPYDGGYGDRGEKYAHDVYKRPQPKFPLGKQDHLRFMIDFNYNSNGWQIIQFEWLRDGDETRKYSYTNENQLWDTGVYKDQAVGPDYSSKGYSYEKGDGEDDNSTSVHVDGEYEEERYNVKYTNDNAQNAPQQADIQKTIREVLDYIQTNILPTLE